MLLSLPERGRDAPAAAFAARRDRGLCRPLPADARWPREHRAGCSVQYLHKLGTRAQHAYAHIHARGTPNNDRKRGECENHNGNLERKATAERASPGPPAPRGISQCGNIQGI